MRRSDPDPERGGEARTGGDLEAGKIDVVAGEVEVAREGGGVAVGTGDFLLKIFVSLSIRLNWSLKQAQEQKSRGSPKPAPKWKSRPERPKQGSEG